MALSLSRNEGDALVFGFGGLRAKLELVAANPSLSQWRLTLPLLGPIDIYLETKNGWAKIGVTAPRSLNIRRAELPEKDDGESACIRLGRPAA